MNHLHKSGVVSFDIVDADFAALVGMKNRQSAVAFFLWLQSLTGTTVMQDAAVAEVTGLGKGDTLGKLRKTFADALVGRFTRRERGFAYERNKSGVVVVKGR